MPMTSWILFFNKIQKVILYVREEKYYIHISKIQVEVTEEVYHAYHQMERHERYLIEKYLAHDVWQYSNLDTENILGEEMLIDLQSAINKRKQKILDKLLKYMQKQNFQFSLPIWVRLSSRGNCKNPYRSLKTK